MNMNFFKTGPKGTYTRLFSNIRLFSVPKLAWYYAGALGALVFCTVLSSILAVATNSKTAVNYQNLEQTKPFLAVGNSLTRRAILDTNLPQYKIKQGDNLYRISRNYGVSLEKLRMVNEIANPARIEAGRILYIPPVDADLANLGKYQVRTGDTINSIINKYGLERWQFKRLNPRLSDPLPAGAVAILPPIPATKVFKNVWSSFIRPVGGHLTSRYGFRWGRMHQGLDIAAPTGTPVKAARNGIIRYAGWMGGYGMLIKIDHGDCCTYYGHLSRIYVSLGRKVNQGEVIGLVGATGRAYGSHLHFEIEKNGAKINPGYLFDHNCSGRK